jgi:hypothetical protein
LVSTSVPPPDTARPLSLTPWIELEIVVLVPLPTLIFAAAPLINNAPPRPTPLPAFPLPAAPPFAVPSIVALTVFVIVTVAPQWESIAEVQTKMAPPNPAPPPPPAIPAEAPAPPPKPPPPPPGPPP